MTQLQRNPQPDQLFDAAIVGGSFAGLSAALYLARGRRTVAVFDAGAPRNRFAGSAHGFLGQDGRTPAEINAAGRADVVAYPTVSIIDGVVTSIAGHEDAFSLASAGRPPLLARRVILAFGMTDMLPDVPGLRECWGRTVLQCPYCHGYEVADRPTGILMTGEGGLHQAKLLRDWTDDLILFSNGFAITPADRQELAAGGVEVVDGVVTGVEQNGGKVSAIVTTSGGRTAREILYTVSSVKLSSDLASQLGCRMIDGPPHPYIAVDELQQTSVAGVFAAGDITRGMYSSVFAAADGVRAAVACHRSLIMPGGVVAKAAA